VTRVVFLSIQRWLARRGGSSPAATAAPMIHCDGGSVSAIVVCVFACNRNAFACGEVRSGQVRERTRLWVRPTRGARHAVVRCGCRRREAISMVVPPAERDGDLARVLPWWIASHMVASTAGSHRLRPFVTEGFASQW